MGNYILAALSPKEADFWKLFASYLLTGEVSRAIWLAEQMNYDLPSAIALLRNQGAKLMERGHQLIDHGNTIIEAAQKQLEAADKIESALKSPEVILHADSQARLDATKPLRDSALAERRREYISVVEAVTQILSSGPLLLKHLFEMVTLTGGVRCKSERSLGSMLFQHPDRFTRSRMTGEWSLVHPKADLPEKTGEAANGKP